MNRSHEEHEASLPVRIAAVEKAILGRRALLRSLDSDCAFMLSSLTLLSRRMSQRRNTRSLGLINTTASAVADNLAAGHSIGSVRGKIASVRPIEFPVFADLVLLTLIEKAAARLSRTLEGDAEGSEPFRFLVARLHEVVAPAWREDYWRSVPGDAELRGDPSGFYERCDDDTKARMHAALAELCVWARLDAAAVAHAAITLAADAGAAPARHVGFYLLDEGRPILEKSIRCRLPAGALLARAAKRFAVPLYLGTIAAGTAGLVLAVFAALSMVASTIVSSILAATLAIPILSLVLNLIHFAMWPLLCPSKHLPSLRCTGEIPADCKTLITVPMIVHSPADIRGTLNLAEQNYVRNRGANIWCALLTDFSDAAERRCRSDEELLHLLVAGVQTLNARHASPLNAQPFLLLHRDREWNDTARVWMGWERKRGKLVELNQLIVRGDARSLRVLEGDPRVLDTIRYVITLDADTRVPDRAADQLIAILAHPLNRAVLTGDGAPVRGFTVLQPRIEAEDGTGTPDCSRLLLEVNAFDCRQDLHQTLFGTSMFCGKGVYDVAAFTASLEGRIPGDAVLSHDHLEGMHGAVGVAAHVVFGESSPAHPVAQMRRAHRWTRGDWQLLPWLLPVVPGETGGWLRSRLSLLDRWRLADNLRQSLVAPAMTVSLILGWLLLPSQALAWTLLVILLFVHQGILLVFLGLSRAFSQRLDIRLAGRRARRELATQAGRHFRQFALIAHQSFVACDAIVRTLFRLWISRQHLLEWTASAESERRIAFTRSFVWYELRASLLFAGALAVLLAYAHAEALPVAGPALCLWLLAPQIAFRSSRPPVSSSETGTRTRRGILLRRA